MTPQSDVALAPFCTMGVGGAARWFVEARTESEVIGALAWARAREADVHVLGGGSNIVISDRGFDGLVIKVGVAGIDTTARDGRLVFSVGAGEPWDPLVARTVDENCAGLECLSGIPGLTGGTPVQNVGAYSQDVSETIARVHAVERRNCTAVTFSVEECAFGYRTSRFKREDRDRYVVTRVDFALRPDGAPTVAYVDVIAAVQQKGLVRPTLQDVRSTVLEIRRRKGMVIEPANAANRSCGSFFVNPLVPLETLPDVQRRADVEAVPHYRVDETTVKIPAAWLIERAGFPRGTARGAVGISPFQAQAIINLGGARAADVLALACDVKRAVWNTFGIAIVPEPVFVGFARSIELDFLLADGRGAALAPHRIPS